MAKRKLPKTRADELRIEDPRAIRALAHPARLVIIDALFTGEEELTATQCAALTGLTASAASYHLRALERWGFVERVVADGDGRERPWRGVARALNVNTGPAAVSDLLRDTLLDRDRKELRTFAVGEEAEPPEWREAAGITSSKIWLTAAETAELTALWRAHVQQFRSRSHPAERPSGARPVRLSLFIAPLPTPPS